MQIHLSTVLFSCNRTFEINIIEPKESIEIVKIDQVEDELLIL